MYVKFMIAKLGEHDPIDWHESVHKIKSTLEVHRPAPSVVDSDGNYTHGESMPLDRDWET